MHAIILDSSSEEYEEEEQEQQRRFHQRIIQLLNLDNRTTTEMIRRAFRRFGEIEHVSNVCTDRFRNGSSVAYVTFAHATSCTSAVSYDRDIYILRRRVTIRRGLQKTRVYLQRIPDEVSVMAIREALSEYDVSAIKIGQARGRNYALVDFEDEDERGRALRMRFVTLDGQRFRIDPIGTKPVKPQR